MSDTKLMHARVGTMALSIDIQSMLLPLRKLLSETRLDNDMKIGYTNIVICEVKQMKPCV